MRLAILIAALLVAACTATPAALPQQSGPPEPGPGEFATLPAGWSTFSREQAEAIIGGIRVLTLAQACQSRSTQWARAANGEAMSMLRGRIDSQAAWTPAERHAAFIYVVGMAVGATAGAMDEYRTAPDAACSNLQASGFLQTLDQMAARRRAPDRINPASDRPVLRT